MTQPIVARMPNGAEYGFKSIENAKRISPDAVAVRYQDNTPYDADEPEWIAYSKMTRDELNAHAAKLGIENPEGLKTKAEVIDAITENTNA